MKCYYTIDVKNKKRVLIPMCYGTIHSLDINDCNCINPLTEYQFQKDRFNEVVKQKNDTIKSMQIEIDHLREVIKELTTVNLKT